METRCDRRIAFDYANPLYSTHNASFKNVFFDKDIINASNFGFQMYY